MSIAVLKGRSAMGRERREGRWRQGGSRAADCCRGTDASDAHEPAAGADAKFLGWQSFSSGEIFPLYAITLSDHPSFQSTVSDVTLRRLHLRIPRTPSPYPEIAPSPWHTLGVELDHPRTAREAMAMAGLDFAVVKNRVELNTGLLEETYATERTDTGEVLGIVGSGYEPVQNRDAF